MEGTPKHDREYYRCVARTLAPGSAALATYPRNVYLPEKDVVGPLNAWLGGLFTPENRDATVAALLDAAATTERGVLTDAEVYAMIDSLGNVGEALNSANPDRLRSLYEQLHVELVYDGDARTVEVIVRPSGGIVRVSEERLAHKPAGIGCELRTRLRVRPSALLQSA